MLYCVFADITHFNVGIENYKVICRFVAIRFLHAKGFNKPPTLNFMIRPTHAYVTYIRVNFHNMLALSLAKAAIQ